MQVRFLPGIPIVQVGAYAVRSTGATMVTLIAVVAPGTGASIKASGGAWTTTRAKRLSGFNGFVKLRV